MATSALMADALRSGDADLVESLLASGAARTDMHVFSPECGLPLYALHYAALLGHLGVIDKLLAHGAALDQPDGAARSPLAFAVLGNQPRAAASLISRGARVERVAGQLGALALAVASAAGGRPSAVLINTLCDQGLDACEVVHIPESCVGWPSAALPLVAVAALGGAPEALLALIDKGARVDALSRGSLSWPGMCPVEWVLVAHAAGAPMPAPLPFSLSVSFGEPPCDARRAQALRLDCARLLLLRDAAVGGPGRGGRGGGPNGVAGSRLIDRLRNHPGPGAREARNALRLSACRLAGCGLRHAAADADAPPGLCVNCGLAAYCSHAHAEADWARHADGCARRVAAAAARRRRCALPGCNLLEPAPAVFGLCACLRVAYCCREHNKAHWREHRAECTAAPGKRAQG